MFPSYLIPSVIADYPRLHTSLVLFWGSRDFKEFLDKTMLMTKDRVDRHGFPVIIIQELFKLQRAHDVEFPQFNIRDKWDI